MLRIPGEYGPQNQLIRAYRESQKTETKIKGPIYGSVLDPLHKLFILGFSETLCCGSWGVSDSCSWDHFHSVWLSHPALIWGYMPSLIDSYRDSFN